MFNEYNAAARELMENNKAEWRVVLDLLRRTERDLYLRISQKMLNHLYWSGIAEAKQLAQFYNLDHNRSHKNPIGENNKPYSKQPIQASNDSLSEETFRVASQSLSDGEILSFIRRWIQQDKLGFLVKS